MVAMRFSGAWGSRRLSKAEGRLSVAVSKQKFALHLQEARLDCAGATKPPQQGGKPMNELELNDGSGAKAANDRPFECSVTPRVFEIFYDCLGGKPSAPAPAARSLVPYLLIGTRRPV
jgi:hypothetical protein